MEYQVQVWSDENQHWENRGTPVLERKQAEELEPEYWDAGFMTRIIKCN